MQIAICDDEREEILKIRNLIFNIQDNYRVDPFLNGQSLLEAVEEGNVYDLLFCDVYLQQENGIEIVRRLLRISPQTAVVFFTTSQEHAIEAFSVESLHYLVKPVSQEDLIEVFRRFGNRKKPRHTLTLRIDRMVNVLYQDEIMRVESHNHNTLITCRNDTVYSIRRPWQEISGMLDDSFVQIKKGVTLNMHYISRMTFRECTTRDGLTFLLRRDQAKDIREKYFAFVKNEMEKR